VKRGELSVRFGSSVSGFLKSMLKGEVIADVVVEVVAE
jgi:hypothetical protein